MDNNALANEIAALRKQEARHIKELQHRMDLFADTHAKLCALLCEAANRVHDAGHIDAATTAAVVQPKD